jgi:Fe-S oxidoreductase
MNYGEEGERKMPLADFKSDMECCCRCSACKFIPLEKVTSVDNANVCPSISRYNFHAYSGGGRMAFGLALLNNKIEYTDKVKEVVYNCQACGACDVSCKYAMDMDVLQPIYEVRASCVEKGATLPVLDKLVASLRKQGPMVLGATAKRGEWGKTLDVKDYTKEKAKVIFHAGCLTCYDKTRWKAAQAAVNLLKKAGVDVGIARETEPCCGGRAYEMGYQADALKQAQSNTDLFTKSGAEIIVTGCADCYYAFKVLYDKFGLKSNLQVLHISEYLAQLIREGKLKPKKEVSVKVTYHDPCHLGRLSEPWIHWQGKQKQKHMRLYDPPRNFRRGSSGIYEPPRDLLRSIPGVKLLEMNRIKEYAWCCGAGGGVKESNPDFANWTAVERIKEAESTGAEILATSCTHCLDNFQDAIAASGSRLQTCDIVELLEKAL